MVDVIEDGFGAYDALVMSQIPIQPESDREVLIVAFPGVQGLDVVGPLEVFAAGSEAAEVGGFSADSDIRLAPDAPVVVVTVAAPISNTEGPEGAELETYDQYTVIYSAASHHGFRVCMGCGDVAVDAMASDYVKGLPDSSFTRDPAEADG